MMMMMMMSSLHWTLLLLSLILKWIFVISECVSWKEGHESQVFENKVFGEMFELRRMK